MWQDPGIQIGMHMIPRKTVPRREDGENLRWWVSQEQRAPVTGAKPAGVAKKEQPGPAGQEGGGQRSREKRPVSQKLG